MQAGVVGIGTMGHQIAIVFAGGGFATLACDRDQERLDRGMAQTRDYLRRRVAKGALKEEDADAMLGRMATTTDVSDLAEADVVVEAVPEDLETKRSLFRALDDHCRADALIATNTSTLKVSEIAAATRVPERCLGAHFLIPAASSPLVELGRGKRTSDETIERMTETLERCGKRTVVSSDSPGFIINRLYIPFLNEAFLALEEGVASAEEIDRACVEGLGHPLGPLRATDASGLDVVLQCVRSLHDQLGEKYRPAPLLERMVAEGRLGRKAGRGVYSYER